MDVSSPLKMNDAILTAPQQEVTQTAQAEVSLFRAIGSASPELNHNINLNQY